MGPAHPDGLAGVDLVTNRDVLDLVCRQRGLNFAPGARWVYSNTGYTLLGIVVERVSGRSLREFTRERFFEPLGMASTFFLDDHAEVVPNRAHSYLRRDGGGYRAGVMVLDTVGATSLNTTVGDLALWIRNLEQPTVGGEAFVREMSAPGRLNNGLRLFYPSGLRSRAQQAVRPSAALCTHPTGSSRSTEPPR